MLKRLLSYFLAFCLLLGNVSCKRAELIPRDELAEVYADLFMTDQWASYENFGKSLDSLSLYAAVFERHGYEVQDFRYSVEEYIKDPDRYAKILKKTMAILEARKKSLEEQRRVLRSEEERLVNLRKYSPQYRFALAGMSNPDVYKMGKVKVYVDSTYSESWYCDIQKGRDTIYVGPRMEVKLPPELENNQDDE